MRSATVALQKKDAICHILDDYIFASLFELYDSCLVDAAT